MKKILAEFIWIDGQTPTAKLRSKTKVIDADPHFNLDKLPAWSFDGSSTYQATTDSSDCVLKPVACIIDPIRKYPHHLALCEVFNA
ncbi:MAG: glutamine synthetase beta-grasp domain-containing protein, partial [Patescibacteria group bacterium]